MFYLVNYLHVFERVTEWINKWVGADAEAGEKCMEAVREMHTSVWISICLRWAASRKVYQSFPIIYIQQFISLHYDLEWVRLGSFAWGGKVSVESCQSKQNIKLYWFTLLVFRFAWNAEKKHLCYFPNFMLNLKGKKLKYKNQYLFLCFVPHSELLTVF